jgi:hypothetical protein
MEYAEAKRWATASVVNSVLLPASAALQFDKTFWALVVTNFVLMHMVWIDQLLRSGTWQRSTSVPSNGPWSPSRCWVSHQSFFGGTGWPLSFQASVRFPPKAAIKSCPTRR